MTLRALSNAEFMAFKFPTPRYLVRPIIEWGGYVMLNGAGEAGKTLLADTLAIAVASGGLFLDEYECRQGPVVIVQVDMPLRAYQDRWRRLDGLASGLPIHHAINDSPIDILKQLPALKELAKVKPALVIFDSLRNIQLLDEDSSATPTIITDRCKHYFPNATILFIHHDRRSMQGQPQIFKGDGSAESTHRGTGAWRDRVSTQLSMVRIRTSKQWFTRLSFGKVQNSPSQRNMKLTIDPTTLLLKPADPTERQLRERYKRDHPDAQDIEIAAYVEGRLDKSDV